MSSDFIDIDLQFNISTISTGVSQYLQIISKSSKFSNSKMFNILLAFEISSHKDIDDTEKLDCIKLTGEFLKIIEDTVEKKVSTRTDFSRKARPDKEEEKIKTISPENIQKLSVLSVEIISKLTSNDIKIESIKRMMLKLDTMHDFLGDDRAKIINDPEEEEKRKKILIKVLGWQHLFPSRSNIMKKKDFEDSLFFWLYNIMDLSKNCRFATDTTMFVTNMVLDNKQSAISTDVRDPSINKFQTFLKILNSKNEKTKEDLKERINDKVKLIRAIEKISRDKLIDNKEDYYKFFIYTVIECLNLYEPGLKKSSIINEKVVENFIFKYNDNKKEKIKFRDITDSIEDDNNKLKFVELNLFLYQMIDYKEKHKITKTNTEINFPKKQPPLKPFEASNYYYTQQNKEILFNNDITELTVISPQVFDSNRSTGSTEIHLSYMDDKVLLSIPLKEIPGCTETDLKNNPSYFNQNCYFKMLEDEFIFYKNTKKFGANVKKSSLTDRNQYILEIKNEDYPIQKIIIRDIQSNEQKIAGTQFVYDETDRSLSGSIGPGVSELMTLALHFIYKEDYEEEVAYNNIFQIKRAGDYSQIWFCRQYNNIVATPNNYKRMMFMTNDRMSASFCLLENVPFAGPIEHIAVYYDPYSEDIKSDYTKIDDIIGKDIKDLIKSKLSIIKEDNIKLQKSYDDLIDIKNNCEEKLNETKVKITELEGKLEDSILNLNQDSEEATQNYFSFSFNDGMTLYETTKNIPKKINMKKYENFNNVYLIDDDGYLKLQNIDKKSTVYVNDNISSKSKSYTDNSTISYHCY